VSFNVSSVQTTWLQVNPTSGALTPFGSTTISVTADVASLGEGTHSAKILVSWSCGGVAVNVVVTRQGAAPVVVFVRQTCASTNAQFSITADATDDFAVASVTVVYRLIGSDATHTAGMTHGPGDTWTFQGAGSLATYTVVATDAAGHNSAPKSGGC
jgi:hypothetical protein